MNELPTLAVGFARCAHRKQVRKYTGEPYATHCERVAELVAGYTDDADVIAAAVLHDVLEDMEVTAAEMRAELGDRVTVLVLQVTDVSRPSDGNREARKTLDREHLARSSPEGATIKLADLIDNTSSIMTHDPSFARLYVAEKEKVLPLLRHGNAALWERANRVLQDAQTKLVHDRLAGPCA